MDGRFPRIVDIDVPALENKVNSKVDEAIVISLDIEPSESWIRLFREEVEQLLGQMNLAEVTIVGQKISFFASTDDYRRLGDEIKRLVAGTSYRLQRTRNAAAGSWKSEY